MATYFSIKNGNFNTSLGTVVGDVSAAGVLGFMLTTVYSYPTTTTSTVTQPIYGVAFQLSSVKGDPEGTIDVILSATDGNFRTASFPVSGLTQKSGRNSISIATPVSWQVFAFNHPLTATTTVPRTMRVGIKTSNLDKVCLMGASLVNLNRAYICTTTGTPTTINDVIHVVGSLSGTSLVTNTINYNIAGTKTYGNFYVHNGGILNFDPTISFNITLAGTQGMQITPDGTVNFGTSSVPVSSTKLHELRLDNCYINVHNGATLNTYGSYKTPYALLKANTAINTQLYPIITDVSNWVASTNAALADKLIVTSNDTSSNTSDLTNLYSKNVTSNFLISSINVHNRAVFPHVSSTYIPSIVNMTRNVRFIGTNTTFGYIRFLDGSVSKLNNTQFDGFRHATYNGLQFCTNSTGFVSLSNCTFNGDWLASTPAFSFDSARTPTHNVSIISSSFGGYGLTTDIITLAQVSANNFTFTDNIVLSSSENGMLIDRLSSTYVNIKNNFLIGSRKNGLLITNAHILSGSVGGIGCMNGLCGSVVRTTNNVARYDGLAGHYNTREGVNISGTMPNLSSTVFYNLTASNNNTSGVLLSGNTNNLFTPIKVNIDGLIANSNKEAGFQGYAITGNLNSMSFNNNKDGNILISIGNANTLFDNVDSQNSNNYYITKLTSPYLNVVLQNPFGANRANGGINYASSFNYDESMVLSAIDNNLTFSEDFTIEGWIHSLDNTLDTKARRIFSFGSNAANSNLANNLQLILGTGDTVAASSLTVFTNTALIVGTIPISTSTWYHFAISRVNGVMRLFINGVEDGSIENNTNFNAGATLPFVIGKFPSPIIGRFYGYLANIRIMNTTGLYSSEFEKPNAPFPLLPNTTFLLNEQGYPLNSYISLPRSNIDILSAINYNTTVFKNSNLQGNIVPAIRFNSSKFEQFSMESTILSSNLEDIGSSSYVNLVQGSYQFNNCTFGTGILSSTIQNYQPEVFNETGFAVMKEGGDPNKHYRLLQSGKISLDNTLAYESNTISEKLEPASISTKIRCGSKLVPINKGESYNIGCYIYKSVGYTGAAPRLILKRNSALGYSDTTLATSVSANGVWELLTNNVLPAQDHGIFEVYVDCSGSFGCGSVNIDNWSLTLL